MNKKITAVLIITILFLVAGFAVYKIKFQHKAGDMNMERYGHTATLLKDGRVLIVGGVYRSKKRRYAEIYDPKTNKFEFADETKISYGDGDKFNQSKEILLKDGRVLLISNCLKKNGKIEIYDPKINKFILSKGQMYFDRYGGLTATLLNNGKVLITGGENDLSNSLSSAEIYDPVKDKFSITGTMHVPKRNHSAILLPNGKVLIAGGGTKSVEIYDPNTGKFSIAGNMINENFYLKTIMLSTGKILIFDRQCEIYDYKTNKSKLTAKMIKLRMLAKPLKLPDGKILIFGGFSFGNNGYASSSVEMYDPKTNKFTLLKDMKFPRISHTVTLLNDGNVLITGGINRISPPWKCYKETEIYKVKAN